MTNWKDANLWILICYALLSRLSIGEAGNVVPVMLWSGQSSSSLIDPLHKTLKHEFQDILTESLGKAQPPILLFVKDNFCVENIKHHKENLLQLSNAGSLTYLTSVESALSIFENLPSYNITKEDDLEAVADGQLAMVRVTDLNAVPEIYNMIKDASPNMIVALTGNSCAYTYTERSKRAVETSEQDEPLIVNPNKQILFYADKLPSIEVNNEEVKLKALTNNMASMDASDYNLTMEFSTINTEKVKLQAQFNISGGYFRFIGIEYERSVEGIPKQVFLKSQSAIIFPFNFSYHCARENIFTYKDKNTKEQVVLKITNLQVQMDTDKFNDAYDCVGFMSIPIWTGIFVTAILALIMIWGLTMIMDIRTMDRFDDPKGKTITISAQE